MVDYFDLDRSIVAVSVGYQDRFLNTNLGKPAQTNRAMFRLVKEFKSGLDITARCTSWVRTKEYIILTFCTIHIIVLCSSSLYIGTSYRTVGLD